MDKYIVFDIETTGLNPWYNDRITCICAKDSEGNIFESSDQKETKIIDSFYSWLEKYRNGDHTLITKNGLGFDIPFILTRFQLYAIKGSCDNGSLKLLDFEHFDLQTVTKKRVSLSDMAFMYNVENKSGDGKNAIKLWKNNKIKDLISYCHQDVFVTERVYLKWNELHLCEE